MPVYYRSDQARIQLNIPGVALPTDSWQKMEGGDNAAETSQLLPGGMAPAIAQGGTPKRSDLTLERPWSDALIGVYKQLDLACGQATGTGSYTVLDVNKQPVPGSTISYTGIVKQVTRPNYDASSSTGAVLQVVLELNESIS